MTARSRWWVAFLFHAPGLWVFCRSRLPKRLVPANIVALALSAILTAVSAALASEHPIWAAIVAWSLGHILWGVYLARALEKEQPLPAERHSPSKPASG